MGIIKSIGLILLAFFIDRIMGTAVTMVVMFVLVAIIIIFEQNRKMSKLEGAMKTRNIKAKTKFEMKYLGGFPSVVVAAPTECYLMLGDAEIHLNVKDNWESISLEDVKEATLETTESLSMAKMAMIGVFALASKKKTSYLKVSFVNKVGDTSHMVFETPLAGIVAQTITKNRYDLLMANKQLATKQ